MDEWYDVEPVLPSKGLVIRTSSIFIVLTFIVVTLRIISRPLLNIKFGWEDLLVMIAVVLFWAQASVHIAAAELSTKIPNIMHPNYSKYNLYIYVSSALYVPCVTIVNISILVLYLRIFTSKAVRRTSIALMVISVMWAIPALFTMLFTCKPVKRFWDIKVPGTCIYFSTYWLVIGIVEIVIITAIFLLPFPAIFQLKLNITKKALLAVVFAVAGVSIITAILRMALGYIPGDPLIKDTIYIYVHTGTAILCACLPTLRPLLALLPSYMHSSSFRHGSDPSAGDNSLVTRTQNKSSRETYQRFSASDDTMRTNSTEMWEVASTPDDKFPPAHVPYNPPRQMV